MNTYASGLMLSTKLKDVVCTFEMDIKYRNKWEYFPFYIKKKIIKHDKKRKK